MCCGAGERTAAILILDNHQGFDIDKRVRDCFADKTKPQIEAQFPDIHIPATFLNMVGLVSYYPKLARGYDDVYVIFGGDKARMLLKFKEATMRFDRVDAYVMAHTNSFDGQSLANIPAQEFHDALSPDQNGHLGTLYTMGCGDGNLFAATSAFIIGFREFVGHAGAGDGSLFERPSPNFLFTDAFIQYSVIKKTRVQKAADEAYSETTQMIGMIPEPFFCAYMTTSSDTREHIRPYVGIEDPSWRDLRGEQRKGRILGDLYGKLVRGELKNMKDFIVAIGGEYWPALQEYRLLEHADAPTELQIHSQEAKAVQLIAAHGARDMLIDIAKNPGLTIDARKKAVYGLGNMEGSEVVLEELIKDRTIPVQVRNMAVDRLYKKRANSIIIGLLRNPKTDPEILHYTAAKAGHLERVWDDTKGEAVDLLYPHAKELAGPLRALASRRGIHPKIRSAARASIRNIYHRGSKTGSPKYLHLQSPQQ